MASILQAPALMMALFVSGAFAQSGTFLRKVSTREIVNDVEASLSDILSGHASSATAKRLLTIEASIWQTFQSLPKNSMGRLAQPAVRHIVHGYFARAHGWQIKGLESVGMNYNTSQVHDVEILQDKAPLLVETLLEQRHRNNGLALTDIVAMVAVLEQLIFDESVTLLEAAYRLNAESVTSEIDEDGLHRVLQSYLVLFGQGSKADLYDATKHHAILELRLRKTEIKDFEHNAVYNFEYARRHARNPFVPRRYSFEVAAEIVSDLAQRYGQWQNEECRDMKAHLAELDSQGTGRVPLGLLYAQPVGESYHFSESADYLRKIGALDETSSTPKVLIANYITGPSNCIASSSYYSVCCLNNCDGIMDEIEHKARAPMVSADRLLNIVRNVSNVEALPASLLEKLESIAAKHGGEVPIHGRLFAQWLHFAFPHECPYPAILENAKTLSTSEWRTASYSASNEEKMDHVISAQVFADASADELGGLWSDHEVLPVLAPPPSEGTSFSSVARLIVQLAAVVLGLRSVYAAWKSAVPNSGKQDCKKDDNVALGFRV